MKFIYSLAFLSLAGVLALQSSPALAQGELSVELSANPNSWSAPLDDVDLTAQVSGTATGLITYSFDCTNNGSFERVTTTNSTTLIAFNVCDYPNPGIYTANVQVTRGGFSASDTAAIFVGQSPTPPPPPPSPSPTLSVALSANPSSGTAPLNDVDLTAQVSGTATGTISYRFDCRNDGTYEFTIDTNTTTFIAFNLCDYASPGVYTAKVIVVRGGVTASDTATITVNPAPSPSPTPTLAVTLSAIPSSGNAPLNDVDLKADVSGTATGNVNYRFDCTNNGTYESEDTVSAASFTKADLCDYATAGTYTARVLVMRGGLTAQDTVAITVNAAQTLVTTPTLSVTLTAIPSSGVAPLNDVDMKADVSGSATGDIDYRFDCTNNGPYEFETIISETSFTKADLCDYPSAGTYTARVFARRGGITAQDTAVITVSQPSVSPPPPSPTPIPTPTLSVVLTPFPSSGTAPLNDVDMAAEVSGTATGAITYRFDCTDDGKFESEDIVTSINFTKADLCDYSEAGLYIARVWVGRGGISAQDTAFVTVNPAPTPPPPPPSPTPTPTPSPSPGPGPTLDVNLFADPNNGVAPLKGVDLNASVGGSATGDITYEFDCTNDGSVERTAVSGHSVFNAVDLCTYPSVGTYTASVEVTRSGLHARSTAQVTVTPAAFALNIAAVGRNKTEGEVSWNDPVFAKPSQTVEFQIFVSSEGTKKLFGVSLKGTLPAKLTYKGNVRVDGTPSSGNLLSGLALGDLEPGQTKTILFDAETLDESQFALGIEDLVASFIASNPEETAADTVTVQVVKGGVLGATNVPTGLLSSMTLALVPTLVILLLALLSYFFLFYVRNRNLLFAFKSRAEVELAHAVAKIRRRERI